MPTQTARGRSDEALERSSAPERERGGAVPETERVCNADAVARALEEAGVDTVFGVQGGAAMPVFDAVHRCDALRLVDMAHEQGAAFAADGYARATGDPGVFLVTSGPGALNALTGLGSAFMDSVPVLALTGQVPRSLIGTDGFQEADPVGMSRSVTKWNRQVRDPRELEVTVQEALARTTQGRPRPTLVDLPKDLTKRDPVPQTEALPSAPSAGSADLVAREPDGSALAEAASVLSDARRPMVLAGHGVVLSGAEDELRRFADLLGAPVATTLLGMTAFPASHELSLGMVGMHGTGPANACLAECDVLLVVGARLDDRATGELDGFAPNAELVHVDVDPTELGKNLEPSVGVEADARLALEALADGLGDDARDRSSWRDRAGKLWDEHPLEPGESGDGDVAPGRVLQQLGRRADEDAIVVSGVGQHQMWTALFFGFESSHDWLTSGGLGAMGYALPAAIGARLGAPERQVIVVDGDGCFHMTANELAIAQRLGLELTVFVLNNRSLGMVRQWQDLFHEGRRAAVDLDHVPSPAALAQAYGARGMVIDGQEELEEVVEAALEPAGGPTVVDVRIPARDDVYPMVPPGEPNHAFLAEEPA